MFCFVLIKDAYTLLEPRAAAAVGQSGLMSLYDAMFAQYGVKIAQVTLVYSISNAFLFFWLYFSPDMLKSLNTLLFMVL